MEDPAILVSNSPTEKHSEKREQALRILVVESAKIDGLILLELLEMAGLSVETTSHGRAAIERLAKEGPPIDLVLMDVRLPDMDGPSAAREIRAAHRATPPVIAMMEQGDEAERVRCLEAGMNDLLARPIEPTLLFEMLSKWTNRRAHVVSGDATALAWPALPGFDRETALRRWNNNEAKLRAALSHFADSHAQAADKVRAALLAGDRACAGKLLHELKGVAGNLGARSIQQAAEALEREVKSGEGAPPSALMTALAQALDMMMQGIAQLAPQPSATASSGAIALSSQEMVRGLRELDELLAQNKMSARQRFTSLKNALAAIHPSHAEKLERDVMRLAYKPARDVVAWLIAQLEPPM